MRCIKKVIYECYLHAQATLHFSVSTDFTFGNLCNTVIWS